MYLNITVMITHHITVGITRFPGTTRCCRVSGSSWRKGREGRHPTLSKILSDWFCLSWIKIDKVICMCECVFSGQTRRAWTGCEFLKFRSRHCPKTKKRVFISNDKPALWAFHASVYRVSQVWWEIKVTEGNEEKRLVRTTERHVELFSVKHKQVSI